jgi:signal peptidase I
VVLAGAGAVARLIRRRLVVVKVDGSSMEPTYRQGDRVLVRQRPPAAVRPGDVIMVAPELGTEPLADEQPVEALAQPTAPPTRRGGRLWLIKRVVAVAGDPTPPGLGPALAAAAGVPVPAGHLIVLGDNPGHSYDSRHEGFVAMDRIRGVAIGRLG